MYNTALFPSRLGEALKANHMKKKDLAQKTGLTTVSISRYFSGVYLPKRAELIIIAETLDASMDWLMGQDSEYSSQDEEIARLRAEIKELKDRLRLISSVIQGSTPSDLNPQSHLNPPKSSISLFDSDTLHPSKRRRPSSESATALQSKHKLKDYPTGDDSPPTSSLVAEPHEDYKTTPPKKNKP